MFEIEEPPAKVLKIDNIDGVTRVTEMSSLPESFNSTLEEHIIGEESGIIEGGADVEQGEGHEEWLSEGILTDDDYNPASQEEGDRTDSQLDTSQDEDNPNDSVEGLNTTAESEANVAESDANIAESEANVDESEANMVGSEANVVKSKAEVADSETNDESEANLIDMKDVADSNVVDNQTNTQPNNLESVDSAESKANVSESVANISKNEAKITQANGNSNLQEKHSKIWTEQNIEETMKHLDGNKDADVKPDPFNSLLIKKVDVKSEKKVKAEVKPETDGNDTDDLLRMLGEDDSKTKKKLTKTVADIRAGAKATDDASSDEDDFVYEGAAKKLKAAKTALAKKQPMKAEPEDMEDGDDENDASADEALILKQIFVPRPKPNILTKTKSTTKPVFTPKVVVKRPPAKNIVNVIERPTNTKVQTPTLKQYQNKRLSSINQSNSKSILKPTPPKPAAVPKAPTFPAEAKRETAAKTYVKQPEIQTPVPFKPVAVRTIVKGDKKAARPKAEPVEVIDDEDFMDDDEYNLNEDEFGESDVEMSKHRQRIMRPEMMDEEVPSDAESHSEDASLYDELPSSESEDLDDWFTLDIRAEKAGDYLPLLGSKAKEMLLEEKRRVAARLQTLRKSHSALCESGKKQAEQLREATMALAELDDMLKAS